MLKSLLVGLDVTENSEVAIGLGIDWGKRFGALVAGLGIIDEPTICGPEPVPMGASGFKVHRDEQKLSEAHQFVAKRLQHFSERCEEEGVHYKICADIGLPYEKIMLEAQRYDAVVIGQQANFHYESYSSDDTLRRVLKDSPRPVVVVPPKVAPGKAILVAFDSTMPSARTLHAFGLLGLYKLDPVHIVSVGETEEEARDHTDRASEFFHNHKISATPHPVVSSEKIGPIILEKARELEAGLIVMGAYSHSTFREFFLGSVTRHVVNESGVTLFMWH